MIETPRLIITARQPGDIALEEGHLALHPEILQLDPSVGKNVHPIFYSVIKKGDNEYIGTCCFYNFKRSEVELGVRIVIPDFWGMGYGSEVVNALCEYVFYYFPVVTVFAKTPAYNTRAIACYQKCKFMEYALVNLDGYDMVFMRRLKEGG